MRNRITIGYQFDPSHFDKSLPLGSFGSLSIVVETRDLSGRGSYWVQWQDVLEFAENLGRHPIEKNDPVALALGHHQENSETPMIGLQIASTGSLGELEAIVSLMENDEPRKQLRTFFRVGYPAVEMFKNDLERLMKGEIEVAELIGH